jgi:hypothetical protein
VKDWHVRLVPVTGRPMTSSLFYGVKRGGRGGDAGAAFGQCWPQVLTVDDSWAVHEEESRTVGSLFRVGQLLAQTLRQYSDPVCGRGFLRKSRRKKGTGYFLRVIRPGARWCGSLTASAGGLQFANWPKSRRRRMVCRGCRCRC